MATDKAKASQQPTKRPVGRPKKVKEEAPKKTVSKKPVSKKSTLKKK